MSKKYAIGIDLGGTDLRVALVSEEGEIARKVRKSSSEEDFGSLLESIEEVNNGWIVGIGLGVAGIIDRRERQGIPALRICVSRRNGSHQRDTSEISSPCFYRKRRKCGGARRKGERGR